MKTSTVQPFVATGEWERAYWSLGGRFGIKADGNQTGGAFAVIEAVFTKLAEPPLHVHHAEDEAWYVTEGHLTFTVGDRTLVAGPGSFVFAPRDVPHTFTVDAEPTRVVIITSPGGGFERLVEEAGTPVGDVSGPLPVDPAKLGPLQARYNFEILGPPPGH